MNVRTVAEVVTEGRRPSVLNIECPKCGVGRGEACIHDATMGMSPSHMSRVDALRAAVKEASR